MNAYQKVEVLREKTPDATLANLCKKAKVTVSAYYSSKAFGKKKKTVARAPKKPRHRHQVLSAAPIAEARMVMVMGTPEQIRQALGGQL
jgi:phage protein D